MSLSRSEECVAAASRPRGRVGVDVERLMPLPGAFSRYFLHPSEEEALRGWDDPLTASLAAWTIKEAVLKALGVGLTVPPKAVIIGDMTPAGCVAVVVQGTSVRASCWKEDGTVVAVASVGTPSIPAISVSRTETR